MKNSLLSIFLILCAFKLMGHSSLSTENEEFTNYLKSFDLAELPLTIKGCGDLSGGEIISDRNFKNYGRIAFRKIASNGNYVATITLGIGDCTLPILTTYKLNGEIIDQKMLAIGYCGSDCGLICSEFMRIDSNYALYTSDSVQTTDCDDEGIEITGTTKKYVIYKEGFLRESGLIKLSEEIKKEIAE